MPAPQQKYLDLDYPNPLPEIPPGGISPRPAKPFEFPNEVIPILIAIGSWWLFSVPAPTKRVSLIIAILFSIVESCFYMTTSEDPVTGAIDPDWTSLLQGRVARHPHTTWEQWVANVVFAGFFFVTYHDAFELLRGYVLASQLAKKPVSRNDDAPSTKIPNGRGRKQDPSGEKNGAGQKKLRVSRSHSRSSASRSLSRTSKVLKRKSTPTRSFVSSPVSWDWIIYMRVALFPFLVWGLEVCEGYVLIGMYGWNPAWIYHGNNALFNGTVHLGHGKFWLALGFLMELVGWKLIL